MPHEIKGRNSARSVKIVSGLLLVIGVVVSIAGAQDGPANFSPAFAIGGLMALIGFFGFVVGRFME